MVPSPVLTATTRSVAEVASLTKSLVPFSVYPPFFPCGVSVIPAYLIGYAVTNIPAVLGVEQIVLESIIVVAMGIVVAWFHR